MGKVTFEHKAAFSLIDVKVDLGLTAVGGKIQGLAKSLAPVRKTKLYARAGSNVGKPAEVGFFRISTGDRIDNSAAMVEIANAHKVKTSAVASTINRGDDKTRAKAAQIMRDLDIETRIISPDRVSGSAQAEARALRGVHVTASGKAVYGGNLRRNIKRSEFAVDQGLRRTVTVRSQAPYSVFVEFGTHRSRAKPFLLPAFKQYGTKDEIAKAMRVKR